MANETLGAQRRGIIFGATAFMVCSLADLPLMRGMSLSATEQGTDRIIIDDPEEAKKLLKAKIDQAFFNKPDIMKDIRHCFHIPFYKPDWVIQVAAHTQIDNAVDEFKGRNPWDTPETFHEKITDESLPRRYKARITRLFHEHVGPDYAKFLMLPAPVHQHTYKENFGEIENLLGCSLDKQLGREVMDAQGKTVINPTWDKVPLWLRPPLNFDYMVLHMGIHPSPFTITRDDLKAVGIPVDDQPKRSATHVWLNQTSVAARSSNG